MPLRAHIAKRHEEFLELRAESHQEITVSQAEQAQDALDLPSADHGFSAFHVKKCPVLLRYVATWRCLSRPIPY